MNTKVRMMSFGALAGIAALSLAGACGGKSSAGNNNNNQGPICGNGVIDGAELCDGSDLGGATCQSLGLGEGDIACTGACLFDVAGCSEQAECGNGEQEYPETCDGTDLGSATCESLGYVSGVLACAADCTHDISGCETCGNGAIEGSEQCDGEDLGGATCTSLGLGTGDLACTASCTFDTAGCSIQPQCGDNQAQGAEVCDGADLREKTCASLGRGTGTLACADDCSAWDFSGCQWCGNGVADPTEDCDGVDLDDTTCVDLDFDGGELGCTNGCTFDTSACHLCGPSDETAPSASNHVPAPETLGATAGTLISVDLYDACGIEPGSITLGLTICGRGSICLPAIVPVTPTITGTGTTVTVSYQHNELFPAGGHVLVYLTAEDVNANVLDETWRFSIRGEFLLGTRSDGEGPLVNAISAEDPDTNFSTGTSFAVGGPATTETRMLIRFHPEVPHGPIFSARLDLGICPPWPGVTPVVLNVDCHRLNVDSVANQSTWNLRRDDPTELAWGQPGASAIPADRQGAISATFDPTGTTQHNYVSDDVLPLVLEWQGGAGYHGILCRVRQAGGVIPLCSAVSNYPPRIVGEYGPPLP